MKTKTEYCWRCCMPINPKASYRQREWDSGREVWAYYCDACKHHPGTVNCQRLVNKGDHHERVR